MLIAKIYFTMVLIMLIKTLTSEVFWTAFAAIFATIFACQQLKINKRAERIEKTLKYQSHYTRLIKALQEFTKNYDNDSKIAIDNLLKEAEMTHFTKDIIKINSKIAHTANCLVRWTNTKTLNGITSTQKNESYKNDFFEQSQYLNSDKLKSDLDRLYSIHTKF